MVEKSTLIQTINKMIIINVLIHIVFHFKKLAYEKVFFVCSRSRNAGKLLK